MRISQLMEPPPIPNCLRTEQPSVKSMDELGDEELSYIVHIHYAKLLDIMERERLVIFLPGQDQGGS